MHILLYLMLTDVKTVITGWCVGRHEFSKASRMYLAAWLL